MKTENPQAFEHLHKLLEELHDAEKLLGYGPKRIAVAQKKVTDAETACADQKEKIRSLKKAADEDSLNLKTREAEIAKLTGQLNQATSNKEYEIIQGQIATRKAEDEALEDGILTLLGDVDDAGTELERLEEELKTTQQKSEDIAKDVASREPGLKSEIERLNGELKEAEKIIKGGDSVATYQRLRQAQGASALARVEDGYCMECNTAATQQDKVRMNLGEFVLCRACGRILYPVAQKIRR